MAVSDIYRRALAAMREQQDSEGEGFTDFLTLEARLLEAVSRWEAYGDTESLRSQRAEVVKGLNELALRKRVPTFNEHLRTEYERDALHHRLEEYEAIERILKSQQLMYGQAPPEELAKEIQLTQISIARTERRLAEVRTLDDAGGDDMCVHYAPPRPDFIGRQDDLNEILRLLTGTSFVPLISLEGPPGVGKTAVAIEVAYQAAEQALVDEAVWMSAQPRYLGVSGMHEATPQVSSLDDVLAAVLFALGEEPGASQSEQLHRVQKALSAKRFLLVIDNFEALEDPDLSVFLRNRIPFPSKALVTTRFHFADARHIVQLKAMAYEEAAHFMRREAQAKSLHSIVNADYGQLKRVWTWSSGLLLAMQWIIGYTSESAVRLDRILLDLEQQSRNVDELLNYLFGSAYESLEDNEKQVLHAATIFASHSTMKTLAAASGIAGKPLRQAIRSLYQRSLIVFDDIAEHYSLLPITKEFVVRAVGGWTAMDAYFKQAAQYFSSWLSDLDEQLSQADPSWQELATERQNILALIDWSITQSQWDMVFALGKRMNYFLGLLGYYQDRWKYAFHLLEAAQQLGRRDLKAWVLIHEIAWTAQHVAGRSQAREYLANGIEIALEIDDRESLALAKRALGLLEYRGAVFETDPRRKSDLLRLAEQQCREALEIAEAEGYERIRGLALRTLGHIAFLQEDVSKARSRYERALESHKMAKDIEQEALTLSDLGIVALKEANLVSARKHFQSSLELGDDHGIRFVIARNKQRLAYVEAALDRWDSAATLLNEALAMYEDMGGSKAVERAMRDLQEIHDRKVPELAM